MIRKPTILVAAGLLCFLTLCSAPRVFAAPQDPPQTEGDTTSRPETSTGIPTRNDVVVVTGTFVPGPLSENNRSVTSLDPREQPLLFGSTVDYLRLEPSIDLRQRGIYGVQSDLSIRGSTFGQSLVLLNGMRL
ncbi:MAG TPA: hypothetical protein VG892_09365, partial [Terriglobales bacterium]|nr:hypothetical protein [Terriglobales bacterium]